MSGAARRQIAAAMQALVAGPAPGGARGALSGAAAAAAAAPAARPEPPRQRRRLHLSATAAAAVAEPAVEYAPAPAWPPAAEAPAALPAAAAPAAAAPSPYAAGGPLPVPNFGYACDNGALRRRHGVATSRYCTRATFDARGLAHASALALRNVTDLRRVLEWNAAHGVRLFRVSSRLFPWSREYELEQLPDFEAIAAALAAAGAAARASGQRLTAHPSHFVKLAARDERLVAASLADLELHARVFDLMGFAPSLWNKINIHVGGVYGSKRRALARFAAAADRLSPGARARLAVENDDRPGSYSVADLLPLAAATGVALTLDLHHHRFCNPEGLPPHDALAAAAATWPPGVRPVVHWSESPEDPARARARPHAHSAFVYGPLDLGRWEAAVDVMVEAKAREAALLLYRDELLPRARAEGRLPPPPPPA